MKLGDGVGESLPAAHRTKGPTDPFNQLLINANNTFNQLMKISKDGKVIIGDANLTSPYNYKLYVQDGILTERVKVAIKTSLDWSDFVFADDYNLMPLHELSSYIEEHNHLPQIPSAEEVVKNGIDLGEMNAKLLQKIEELTLYMLEQQKQMDKQQEELNAIKAALQKQ